MFFKFLLKPFLSRENNPIWFIMVDRNKEGPFSINDLKKNSNITPLTLTWRKGFDKWVPMGSVEELRRIFEQRVDRKNNNKPPLHQGSEIVMEEGRMGFFPSIWWLILAIALVIYILVKLWLLA